jgi:Amt family ammonium transporter
MDSPWITLTAAILLIFTLVLWRMHLVREQRRREAENADRSSLFHHSVDAVAAVDEAGLINRINAALTELTGFPPDALSGRSFVELAIPAQQSGVQHALRGIVRGKRRRIETTIRRAGGRTLEVELSSIPVIIDGVVRGAYQIVRDITDRKELERELQNRALHDYLTGLPNRALFSDRLYHALERARRDGGRIALLYVDLDKFKLVNDEAGHAAGDALLREVAARLRTVVRGGDTVARVGGDEFAVLLEDLESVADAGLTGERIVALVRTPMEIEGKELQVGASVGVAVSSEDTEGPDELVKQADLAMYEAKRRGGFSAEEYQVGLEELHADSNVELEGELRRGIERGELTLRYQPIVDIVEERIVGFEALVRWEHPRHGLLLPSTFIPMAEESSLIAEVDRWVLEHSLRETREVMAGSPEKPLFLSVNLSGRHFVERDFVDAVSQIILDTGFDPESVQLEITESAAGGDLDMVRRLKALGVKVAIDDFGTGFSSLGYVKDLDVDVLKVDKSFVLGLGADPSSVAIVRTIITLAEMMELGVIIEGIENSEQLTHLEDLGGRLVQGYYYGRPLELESIPEMLRNGPIIDDPRQVEITDSSISSGRTTRARGTVRPYLPV